MKARFVVNGIELTNDLEKYANQKVAHLNKRILRKFRSSTDCQITFTQAVRKGVKLNTCDIVLTSGGDKLKACETTQHMYAALDIVVVQIDQQLKVLAHKERAGLIRRHFRTN